MFLSMVIAHQPYRRSHKKIVALSLSKGRAGWGWLPYRAAARSSRPR